MANTAYWSYHFQLTDASRDVLPTQLDALGALGFEERDATLVAYFAVADRSEELEVQLTQLAASHGISYTREGLADENWNQQWEASFRPVQVDDFVGIRAEFHPPFANVEHELLIHPRMAFGTGHHATTYLVMQRMGEMDLTSKSVFDFGCGTGILAILARRLGVGTIDAVDIEAAATENTLVNMEANQVADICIYTGTLADVPARKYDLILANINRHVILQSLAALYERTESGGDLLVSGILIQDQALVLDAASETGWTLELLRERGGWLLLHFKA